jgi:hypothetical protein
MPKKESSPKPKSSGVLDFVDALEPNTVVWFLTAGGVIWGRFAHIESADSIVLDDATICTGGLFTNLSEADVAVLSASAWGTGIPTFITIEEHGG